MSIKTAVKIAKTAAKKVAVKKIATLKKPAVKKPSKKIVETIVVTPQPAVMPWIEQKSAEVMSLYQTAAQAAQQAVAPQPVIANGWDKEKAEAVTKQFATLLDACGDRLSLREFAALWMANVNSAGHKHQARVLTAWAKKLGVKPVSMAEFKPAVPVK